MRGLEIGKEKAKFLLFRVDVQKSNRNNRENNRTNKKIQQLHWIQISTNKNQPGSLHLQQLIRKYNKNNTSDNK